jgi:hypothetical protein
VRRNQFLGQPIKHEGIIRIGRMPQRNLLRHPRKVPASRRIRKRKFGGLSQERCGTKVFSAAWIRRSKPGGPPCIYAVERGPAGSCHAACYESACAPGLRRQRDVLQGSGGVRASTLLSGKDLAGVPAVRADGRKRQRAVRKADIERQAFIAKQGAGVSGTSRRPEWRHGCAGEPSGRLRA